MTRTLHVGFIMDGNGLWAQPRSLPRAGSFDQPAKSNLQGGCREFFCGGKPTSAWNKASGSNLSDTVPGCLKYSVEQLSRVNPQLRTAGSCLLRIAVDYSSRDVPGDAARQMASENCFDPASVSRALQSFDIDLIIRTASEQRLSDFFLWESAYAEVYFSEVLWPDYAGEPENSAAWLNWLLRAPLPYSLTVSSA